MYFKLQTVHDSRQIANLAMSIMYHRNSDQQQGQMLPHIAVNQCHCGYGSQHQQQKEGGSAWAADQPL
jgi:hypothetical protein